MDNIYIYIIIVVITVLFLFYLEQRGYFKGNDKKTTTTPSSFSPQMRFDYPYQPVYPYPNINCPPCPPCPL